MGHPVVLAAGLAAAVLPDVRRVRGVLQGTIETTEWEKYGRGKDPQCANCMAHSGYEPSAVIATMSSLKDGIRALRES